MTLKESLETIKDTRVGRCKKHSLVDILMIVFFGLLCGYKSIEAVHLYAELSESALKKYLALPNGIPSADTILRVLAKIDPVHLGNAFVEYAKSVFGDKIQAGDVIGIDGKTECGSEYAPSNEGGAAHKAVHMVSAWASRLGVCFGQVKTEEKSNEITAIPELLELLDLKGVVVTIDAMGCQKKIAAKITEKKSEYVLALKGNQEKIYDCVSEFFTGHELDERYCERYKIQKYESEIEIGHGRIERRGCFLCTNIKWLTENAELAKENDKWPNLKAFGMVRCRRIIKKTGKESIETRFFLTSLTDAKKACDALRSHWGVENCLHWELDVVFGEDLSQLRKDNSAANMNIMRKIVINALKQTDFSEFTKSKNLSIAGKQMLCNKREECFEKVIKNL